MTSTSRVVDSSEQGIAIDCNGREKGLSFFAYTFTVRRRLAAALDRDFPLDTLVQRYWLLAIRAAIALERKDQRWAVEQLQLARDSERLLVWKFRR